MSRYTLSRLSQISLAVLAAMYFAPPTALAQSTAISSNQSYDTDTALNFEGSVGFQIPNDGAPSNVTINIAEGSTLTINHAVSQENVDNNGTSNATHSRTIDFTRPGTLTFQGGNLVIRKENFFANDASQSYTEQVFIRAGGSSNQSELVFDTENVTFEGDVMAGFGLSGQNYVLTFKNGFTMNIDRSEALNQEKTLFGANLENGSFLRVEGDSQTSIIAGKNESSKGFIMGVRLIGGSGLEFKGNQTFDLDVNGSSLANAYGIYAASNTDASLNKDITATGNVNIHIHGGLIDSTNAYGLFALRDVSFENFNVAIEDAKQVISLYAKDNADIAIDHFTSRVSNSAGVWGIYATAGAVTLGTAELINSGITGSNYGIRASNSTITVTNSLVVDARDALSAASGSTIDIQKDFENLSESWIGAGDGGIVKVNSSGTGVVNFTGATDKFASNTDTAGVIEMTIGGNADQQSSWNVIANSTLDKLTLGTNGRINFFITPDMSPETIINGTGSMIEVSGNNAVVLSNTPNSGISLVVHDTEIAVGDVIGLISSEAGFKDEGDTVLLEGTSLNHLKKDLTVQKIESLIRISKSEVKSDQYDLFLESDDRLVAEILSTTSSEDIINDETDALLESSLSTMTTHFAADDLFVDAVLRSRDGKRDGLFTAARGGKWSYDTRTRIENNIVSGLLGYGAKLSNDLTMGAFIEMGHGSYDTRTHISGSTKAGGGSHNYGGLGLFGDYAMPSIEGLHFTGYLKVGLLRNEFNSNIAGANVDYDRTGVYWGAHLGTHYDWDLTQSIRSRVFLSYFYDGQGDESFDIAGDGDVGGAHVSYDAIHAHRVQLGSMFEFAVSDTWRPYLGLTFEQILAAEAKGTATDVQGSFDLNSSDLEGSTGILSAGWTYQDGNFSTELGLNGYAGTRNGVSGQIQANWKF